MILSQLGHAMVLAVHRVDAFALSSLAFALHLPVKALSRFCPRDGDYFAMVEGGRAIITIPNGYDTVLGYFERTNPEAFNLLYDPQEDLREDEQWLAAQCGKLGLKIVERGDVRAYPVELLSKRLG